MVHPANTNLAHVFYDNHKVKKVVQRINIKIARDLAKLYVLCGYLKFKVVEF